MDNQEQQNKENIENKAVKSAAKEIVKEFKEDSALGIEVPAYSVNEKVLVIRHDKPQEVLPLRDTELVKLSGVIDTVSRYLSKRHQLIEHDHTTIIVNREKMSISLRANETDYYGDKVSGKLEVHPDFLAFGINQDKEYSPDELGNFLRMHRYAFSNKQASMDLVKLLKTFNASVNTKVQEVAQNNGDRSKVFEQVVQSNVPAAFDLHLPLFKAEPAKTFEVEIIMHVDGGRVRCTLESPDAQESMDNYKNQVIDQEIAEIVDLCPDILIIEE